MEPKGLLSPEVEEKLQDVESLKRMFTDERKLREERDKDIVVLKKALDFERRRREELEKRYGEDEESVKPQLEALGGLPPRLLDKLNQRLNRKVTLITAPAGFGKTTLGVTWLRSKNEGKRQKVEKNKTVHLSAFSPLPFGLAWLSLDENDSDLGLFAGYLVAAIKTVFPDACPETSSQFTAAPTENLRKGYSVSKSSKSRSHSSNVSRYPGA